ncbi:hypothetical protein HK405_010290, partial [Cladochytrium tenue]
ITPISTYLSIAMPASILVLRWAPHPLDRFMRVKDVPLTEMPRCVDILEYSSESADIVIGLETDFLSIDLQTSSTVRLQKASPEDIRLGAPKKSVSFEKRMILCYEHAGVVVPSGESKPITWRNPLTFAGKLGNDYLVTGSNSVVYVINGTTSKTVHVFETKREKIKSLQLLSCRGSRLFLLAEEMKNGVKYSIVSRDGGGGPNSEAAEAPAVAASQQQSDAALPMVRMAAIQFALLAADLLISLFADSLRHVAVNLVSVYLLQYVLLSANTVILFVRFTHTYPFRAGVIGVMVAEFRPHLFAIAAYHLSLLAARAFGV